MTGPALLRVDAARGKLSARSRLLCLLGLAPKSAPTERMRNGLLRIDHIIARAGLILANSRVLFGTTTSLRPGSISAEFASTGQVSAKNSAGSKHGGFIPGVAQF